MGRPARCGAGAPACGSRAVQQPCPARSVPTSSVRLIWVDLTPDLQAVRRPLAAPRRQPGRQFWSAAPPLEGVRPQGPRGRISCAPRNSRLASASPQAPSLRFGLAVAAALVAVGLVDSTADILPGGGAFLLLLLPVMVVSLGLGVSAGLLTLGLCALGAGLLVPLRGHPWLSDPAHLIRMALYLIEGALVAILAVGLRATAKVADTRPPLTDDSELDPMTTRELEVLTLAAAGLKTDEIARQIFVSRNTVKTHLAHTYAKLGARNRAEAVSTALRIGVIELVPGERERGPGLPGVPGDDRQPPVSIRHGVSSSKPRLSRRISGPARIRCTSTRLDRRIIRSGDAHLDHRLAGLGPSYPSLLVRRVADRSQRGVPTHRQRSARGPNEQEGVSQCNHPGPLPASPGFPI